MSDWQAIASQISAATGQPFAPHPPNGQSGGCINRAFTLGDNSQTWFIKTNRAALLDMFEAEAEGLNELAASAAIRVPRALCTGVTGDTGFIVMEYVELGHGNTPGWRRAGAQLAALHRATADNFGWKRDNTIGATPQLNDWRHDWIAFWRDQRLGFQLAEAASNGYRGRLQSLGEQLMTRFPALIDHGPQPPELAFAVGCREAARLCRSLLEPAPGLQPASPSGAHWRARSRR